MTKEKLYYWFEKNFTEVMYERRDFGLAWINGKKFLDETSDEEIIKWIFRSQIIEKWGFFNSSQRIKKDIWVDNQQVMITDHIYGLETKESRLQEKFYFYAQDKKEQAQKKLENKLTPAKPTSNDSWELVKKNLEEINRQKYLEQAQKLIDNNKTVITSLEVSPQENNAAIERLNQINKELKERKNFFNEEANKELLDKIKKNKDFLTQTESEINSKTEEVKTAEENEENEKVKELNFQYNELRKKRGAILVLLESLKQSQEYGTFSRFQSIDDLYNPRVFINTTQQQDQTTNSQDSNWDKVEPWLWGAVILIILIFFGYYLYQKYFSSSND